MIEQAFHYTTGEVKTMEQVVREEKLHLNHIVLLQGESFPKHAANATVYMTVLRGELSIELNDQPVHGYKRGDVLKIPEGTVMQGLNRHADTLELWIVKIFT
jgi:quercetin dioxygenase-like cupin family protein